MKGEKLNTEQKIDMERKQIKKFANNPALSKSDKAFYIKMFQSNIKKYLENE